MHLYQEGSNSESGQWWHPCVALQCALTYGSLHGHNFVDFQIMLSSLAKMSTWFMAKWIKKIPAKKLWLKIELKMQAHESTRVAKGVLIVV